MTHYREILNEFAPISLEEMDSVKLMNRTDTKFFFNISCLPDVLKQSKNHYRVLNILNNNMLAYKSLYFDTPDKLLYLKHHNGYTNRYKVRIRNYVESNLFFLEIKKKYKGRTDKKRVKLNNFESPLSSHSLDFIQKVTGQSPYLQEALWNNFNRITLVNTQKKERITIDLNLTFIKNDQSISLNNLVIAEIKQEQASMSSQFAQALKNSGIREGSISKYCMGNVLLNKKIKYNNFKPQLLALYKINPII